MAAVSYPGVYVKEIPSGVRTIAGVPTAITAFIGRAQKGPTNEPIVINSPSDFGRIFGGLWEESLMTYAVRDFFRNGGGQAVIVRLFEAETKKDENGADVIGSDGNPEKLPGKVEFTLKGGDGSATNEADNGKITLTSKNEGAWGANIRIYAHQFDLSTDEKKTRFNLVVHRLDGIPKTSSEYEDFEVIEEEIFYGLSVKATDARYVETVLNQQSKLIDVKEVTGEELNNPTKGDFQTGKTQEHLKNLNSILANNITDSSGGDLDQTLIKGLDGTFLNQQNFIDTAGTFGEAKKGLYALKKADIFNLLCIAPYKKDGADVDDALLADLVKYCAERRAILLVDPKKDWDDKKKMKDGLSDYHSQIVSPYRKNAALFFPRLKQANPLKKGIIDDYVPCGAIAGIIARTDAERGFWKSPAGLEAGVSGTKELSVKLNDAENGELNPLGINCLRTMPGAGHVVWGARTLDGSDRAASEWKYLSVRRVALFIEESLYRGTHWVVFEPNDEPLWSQIRLSIGGFMNNLFRQGAFQGKTSSEAYFVKCDRETTTQNDIDLGIVNIVVGFAPLKPAEFVVIKLQQIAGNIQT
jgi:phage tail sheath protein FI